MNNYTGFIKANRSNHSVYLRMLEAVGKGELIRLKNGLYADKDSLADRLVDMDLIVPGGVLCLYSAWSFYNLTTQIPEAFFVAIDRGRKIVLPRFPDIKLVFQKKELLVIGKTEREDQGVRFMITDLERSVCDAVKYRNKIGIDVMNEIINSYLNRKDRNLSRLTEYAKQLRVYTTLHQILQIKL